MRRGEPRPNEPSQRAHVHRLHQHIHAPSAPTPLANLRLVASCERRHDRNDPAIGTQPGQQRQPIAIGKPKVEEDDIGLIAPARLVRLPDPAGCADSKAGVLEQNAQRARDERVVLDDEDVGGAGSYSRFSLRQGRVK